MDERIRQAEARVEQKLSLEEKDLFDRRQKLLADMEGIRLREFELNSQRELLDRSATVTNFILQRNYVSMFEDRIHLLCILGVGNGRLSKKRAPRWKK